MDRVLQIIIVADDITGAADTGVQFCPALGPVLMIEAAAGAPAAGARPTRALAVFTNTRNADAHTAADVVRQAAEKIRRLAPRVVYKKIDSCLRGNLGAEIDALVAATGARASFVAPALPQQGRTTVNDCHMINGIPVAETEIGRDPLSPVLESRLSRLLSAQSRLPVGRIDLACIEMGPDALAHRVWALLAQGCRHITFDAARAAHLAAIAACACTHFDGVLLAGSAGLAQALSRFMGQGAPLPGTAHRPKIKKWLFVCGSASRVLADQAALLARSAGWPHVSLEPSMLLAGDGAAGLSHRLAGLADAWRAGSLILSIKPIADAGASENPARLVQGLAAVATGLLGAARADGVFLSGGDTAEAFWRHIGAAALRIREEPLPGLVRGEFVGGRFDALDVVTKAGAFGQRDTLSQLVTLLN